MKKLVLCMAVLLLAMSLLVACGGSSEDGDKGGSKTTEFDAGNVSATIPKGWKAFAEVDVFSENLDENNPDVITIIKGAKEHIDQFTKPYIRVDFYGTDRDLMGGLKDWYENTEDITPFTTGTHNWTGFITTDNDCETAILVAEEGEIQYQVSIFLKATSGTISLEDADVKAILESIRPSAAESAAE